MMTVNELRRAVAQQAGVPISQVEDVLDVMSVLVTQELAGGENVVIPGLGILKLKTVAAHVAHNPRTGEPVEVPEKRRVKFQPAAGLARVL